MAAIVYSSYFGNAATLNEQRRRLPRQQFPKSGSSLDDTMHTVRSEGSSSSCSNITSPSTITKTNKRRNPLKKLQKLFRFKKSSRCLVKHCRSRRPYITHIQAQVGERPILRANKALDFLTNDCPEDLLPFILAFAGPRVANALGRTNKQWHSIVNREATWKVMSEELGKWKEGDRLPSTTWKSFYSQNPCVPIDYIGVREALSALSDSNMDGTIWLRPGFHILKRSLEITTRHTITIKTMEKPTSQCFGGFRDVEDYDIFEETRAILCCETYLRNQPIMFIRSGNVIVEDVTMHHQCAGTNLWGGNSAIRVEPARGLQACLALDNVDLTSATGYGVVATRGARLKIERSYVHECAASGIYMCGHDTEVSVESSDIVGNGIGDRGNPYASFVPTEHAGIVVVDNGPLSIQDCNMSWNMGAGVTTASTMSGHNETFNLKVDNKTDMIDNLGTRNPTSRVSSLPYARRALARTELMKIDESFNGPKLIEKARAESLRSVARDGWDIPDHFY